MSGFDLTPLAQPGVSEHRHPLLPTPAELQQLSSGLGISTIQANITALQTAIGAPATPSTITPDAGAVAGTTVNGRAYGDHVHAIAAASPSTLTLTATNGEGVSSSFARADHIHATTPLGWSRVARQRFTTNGAVLASPFPAATDWSFAYSPDATRSYMVCVVSQASTSGVTAAVVRWRMSVLEGATEVYQVPPVLFTGNQNGWFNGFFEWEPTSGSKTLSATVTRDSGDGSIQFQASAAKPRAIIIYDVGPR